MTSTEAPQGEKRVISRVRFTSELCGYGEIGDYNIKDLQDELARDLEKFFKGKVPVGNKFPRIGLLIRDSRDPKVGTACTGDILVYLGVEGEDLERICNQALEDPEFKKKHPITWWEQITEESERRRQEELAARKEYSKKLRNRLDTEVSAAKADARKRASSLGTATSSPETYVPPSDVDPDDLF